MFAQIIKYIMARWPYSLVCTLNYLIIIRHVLKYWTSKMLVRYTLSNVCLSLIQFFQSLSHPSLRWLYVFSSFPRPRPRLRMRTRPPPPPPPPQWLLLLTSKPFKLNLRYLGQRKYRSGKIYWMTFWWPWPKVMVVTLINKNLLVCRIKWEPFNQSIQSISLWSCLLPD